jgi:hypothetical protein
MNGVTAELPENYELVMSSDLHVGCPNVNEDTIKEMIDYVGSNKHVYMTNLGDNIEAIKASDKRFAHSNTKYKTPLEQRDAVIKMFMPIRKKIVAWGTGNHERCLHLYGDIGFDIAKSLDVPYGNLSYTLSVNRKGTNSLMHKMFFRHGNTAFTGKAGTIERRLANMISKLKIELVSTGVKDCILMGMGHAHRSVIVEPSINKETSLYSDTKGHLHEVKEHDIDQTLRVIPADYKWFVANPSFMKLYGNPDDNYVSYAEAAGYAPSDIGYSIITVSDAKVTDVKMVKL